MMAYLLLGLLLSSAAGLFYKLSTRARGAEGSTLVATRVASTLVAFLYLLVSGHAPSLARDTLPVLWLGFVAGASVAVGRWAFLKALRFGKVSTSWGVMSLAVVIPIAVSIFVWKESPDARRTIGLSLMPLAVILLSERHA